MRITDFPDLLALARAQAGAVTTRQANALGLLSDELAAFVAAGVLRHPFRGIYLVSDQVPPSSIGQHRQLATAALLLYPDGGLTGASALVAHDLPTWGMDLERPEIGRPVDRGRGVRGVRVRRWDGSFAMTELGPTVPVAHAVCQAAMDWGVTAGVLAADAMLFRGLCDDEGLRTAVARVSAWPHGSRAAAMLAHVDGRSESVGESRTRLQLALAGIPLRSQVVIQKGTFSARVDFLVEGSKVIVEFDGRVKYASGDPSVLWAEKRREDILRSLGYTVVRITWADLERPGRAAAKVWAALRAASAA